MPISYSPKVGELLDCNFGQFETLPNESYNTGNFDRRIPPEMIKKRPVVVLGGKFGQSALVIPISSSLNQNFVHRGLHVHIPPACFPTTDVYDERDRWAKAELIQHVSRHRLYKIRNNGGRSGLYLSREIVDQIQRAVIAAISAKSLISNANRA
jgi:uncharacterized protein YifN (PemK superfamily)